MYALRIRSSHTDTKFEGISLLHHKPLSAASSTSVGSAEFVGVNSALPQLPPCPSLRVRSEAVLCSPAQLLFLSGICEVKILTVHPMVSTV